MGRVYINLRYHGSRGSKIVGFLQGYKGSTESPLVMVGDEIWGLVFHDFPISDLSDKYRCKDLSCRVYF